MSEDRHIARKQRVDPIERARRGEKLEALCGATASEGGNLVCGPASMATCWKCILLRCGRPVPAYPPTPEHDRLKAAKWEGRDATQLVGEFLDWLGGEGIVLARSGKDCDELYPVYEKRQLLAKFFEIDENALESEKSAMLTHLRDIHAAQEWANTEGRKTLKSD